MFLGHLPPQEATDGKPFPPSADEEMALGTTPIASEIFDEPTIPYESLTDDHSAARSSGSDTNRSEPTQETEESGRSFDTSRIHKRDLEQARVNRRSRANKATKAGSYKKPRTPELDLSLVLGMERTLFAALNNAWLLALGGVGLMSVGNGDRRATNEESSSLSEESSPPLSPSSCTQSESASSRPRSPPSSATPSFGRR